MIMMVRLYKELLKCMDIITVKLLQFNLIYQVVIWIHFNLKSSILQSMILLYLSQTYIPLQYNIILIMLILLF